MNSCSVGYTPVLGDDLLETSHLRQQSERLDLGRRVVTGGEVALLALEDRDIVEPGGNLAAEVKAQETRTLEFLAVLGMGRQNAALTPRCDVFDLVGAK